MVTAGVFLVARMSPMFELAPYAKDVVVIVGAVTAFFAATVGLVQNDIKRVIAYSTCSQLGYMFVALGVGAYGVGIFGCFWVFGSIDFDTIFAAAPGQVGKTIHFLSWEPDALTVLCLLLFMGAMGKSAQFLLHTWLPDAM